MAVELSYVSLRKRCAHVADDHVRTKLALEHARSVWLEFRFPLLARVDTLLRQCRRLCCINLPVAQDALPSLLNEAAARRKSRFPKRTSPATPGSSERQCRLRIMRMPPRLVSSGIAAHVPARSAFASLRPSPFRPQPRDISQGPYAREKEIGAATHGDKLRQAAYPAVRPGGVR
jgi:hypothetical protein